MAEQPYRPYTDSRLYPGAHLLGTERAERLRTLTVDVEELTTDDMVFAISRALESMYHVSMRLISEACGEEQALAIAKRVGYLMAGSNYRKFQRRFGVQTLGPERMCMYQDLAHLLNGADMAHCYTEYDAERCIVRRTRCSFYTQHPKGAGHYCLATEEGFLQAYRELDPGLDPQLTKAMPRGDAYCEHVFTYGHA